MMLRLGLTKSKSRKAIKVNNREITLKTTNWINKGDGLLENEIIWHGDIWTIHHYKSYECWTLEKHGVSVTWYKSFPSIKAFKKFLKREEKENGH